MLYLVIDLATGEIVEKINNQAKAENRCQFLEEVSAYVYGRARQYTYTLAE